MTNLETNKFSGTEQGGPGRAPGCSGSSSGWWAARGAVGAGDSGSAAPGRGGGRPAPGSRGTGPG